MQQIWKRRQLHLRDMEKEEFKELNKILTPNVKTIEDLEKFFNTTAKKFAKTLIYKADDRVVAVMVRGDRQLNEIKVKNAIGGVIEFEMADPETVMAVNFCSSWICRPNWY